MPSARPTTQATVFIQPGALGVSSLLLTHLIKFAHSKSKGIGMVVRLTRSAIRPYSGLKTLHDCREKGALKSS
jgi:hypothetical protein